ncbi:MAG: sigma 54-interacting transcriptional regulator [Sandaracinaceae bacterium]
MSDLETVARPPRARRRGPLGLRVVEGADAGAHVTVDRRRVIGSSSTCDLALADEMVSRRHLAAEPAPHGVRITDLESRNGSYHGEIELRDATLPEGAHVRIGATVLVVERADDEPLPRGDRTTSFGRFLGAAEVLQPMYEALARVAPTDATVLLEGESGTGKELLAEAIHEESHRAEGPFVVVDCGALPEQLVESELFGHERGAFTGADQRYVGAFERAQGGTVFLDEIGELPAGMQTRLLRVLESRRVRRLGGATPIELDLRVVAATNRDLEREIEHGRFRLDLFHRLAVVLLRVPPLRERADDIPQIARAVASALGREDVLDDERLARMATMAWRGNVRELRNHVERLVLLGDVARALAVPSGPPASAELDAIPRSGEPYAEARARLLERFTDLYTEDMVRRHGSVSAAARAAGVNRRYFQRLKSS